MGRRKRGWNAAAGLTLGDLRRLCEQKEAEISKLASRREALVSELAGVEAELSGAGAGAARGRPARRGPGRPRKAKPARGKVRGARRAKKARKAAKARKARKAGAGARGPRGSAGLQNMIRKILASSKEPMKLASLAKAVLDSGYKTSSSRFGVIVGQRLSEMKDVKKAGRGLYTMRSR